MVELVSLFGQSGEGPKQTTEGTFERAVSMGAGGLTQSCAKAFRMESPGCWEATCVFRAAASQNNSLHLPYED
jgi:hypothetical protein